MTPQLINRAICAAEIRMHAYFELFQKLNTVTYTISPYERRPKDIVGSTDPINVMVSREITRTATELATNAVKTDEHQQIQLEKETLRSRLRNLKSTLRGINPWELGPAYRSWAVHDTTLPLHERLSERCTIAAKKLQPTAKTNETNNHADL